MHACEELRQAAVAGEREDAARRTVSVPIVTARMSMITTHWMNSESHRPAPFREPFDRGPAVRAESCSRDARRAARVA
jgi:hypothetical protein